MLVKDQPPGSYAYFDNYFASPDLLSVLKRRNINATCTLRADRMRAGPFVKRKDELTGMVVIYNPIMLDIFNDTTHCYAEGTFQCSPKFFTQMYTFSVLDNGYYIPFMYFLVPDKLTFTYVRLLHLFRNITSDKFAW